MPETIIPDGITPDVGWRVWEIQGGHLLSMNGTVWEPREALEAQCHHPPKLRYVPRRYGRLVPAGRIFREISKNGAVIGGYEYGYETSGLELPVIPAPTVQLPRGWGYEVEKERKEVPDESCQCGIYALKSRNKLVCSTYMSRGEAVGMVSLWGKVIPAQDGYRAQYAYPLQIYTDARLHDYGVPVRPRAELGNDIPVRMLKKGR